MPPEPFTMYRATVIHGRVTLREELATRDGSRLKCVRCGGGVFDVDGPDDLPLTWATTPQRAVALRMRRDLSEVRAHLARVILYTADAEALRDWLERHDG